jgi:putative tryptophan/tyrosine transport system substrate-binding protein
MLSTLRNPCRIGGAIMRRREFISLFGGAAVSWPLAARAQQPTMPVVGYLYSGAPEASVHVVTAFRRGLSETGFVEGRNVAVEYRWADNDAARLPELAADLVRRRVAVIAAANARAALVAKAATATIPIVFYAAADAVETGLVTNLSRPGGNLTGVNSMSVELGAKRLGLLHELLPRALRFGILVDPRVPAFNEIITTAQAAAATIGRPLEVLAAGTNREIDAAFARAVENRVDALMIGPAQLFNGRRVQLTTLAVRYAVPMIFTDRSFAEVGGLMSYSASMTDQHRQLGIYVGRVLKGEKPADLPVMQPTKFEFVINMQTARLLGIEVPPTLLAIADEVIE